MNPWIPGQKADPVKRMLAFLVDGAIAAGLCLIPYLGHILAGVYLLLRDALPIPVLENKSVGKKLFALGLIKPQTTQGGQEDYLMSIKRNWMFALGPLIYFLVFIPVLGWLLDLVLVGGSVLISIIETVLIFSDPQGIRIGDKLAGTQVIEIQ
ncbi:hypothetical protein [Desulfatirhabdium butyrativorans]|uniref:hypothetical protein n=1 Tax=Desulfatirhabdium butyrativorans TaxID=340467 RepID=UPI0012EB1ADA|nr:hypothetical protein [Desulfatirhabdium butyrativorans]